MEIATVASTDSTALSGMFSVTVAPVGRANSPFTSLRKDHAVLLDVSARRDEGLLAWLSASSSERSVGDSDFGNDRRDYLADDPDGDHDISDRVFEGLAAESLLTI